ncbi:MAG TPA: DUF4082 domain-containing protein, partial [Candidatus Sulfotelmatobacter sp.]|nr:DUF4082 domain-containing protein [Candidatus Sulfotelmatobacter sp.]
LDHFTWAPIAVTQLFNVPFPVSIQARDAFENLASNYTGTISLSAAMGLGSGVSGTLLTNPVSPSYSSGDYTMGYAFTPNTNLTVTHVRHYFGTKVSIWTDTGTLLASQNVVSTPGTWMETALSTPVVLQAGTRYRVGAATAGSNYYYREDLGYTFADGVIEQSYYSSMDNFPVTTSSARWWFVDLRYAVGASEPVVMSPATAGPFSNGLWSGTARVLQAGTNISLRAADTLGHSGGSGVFTVEMPTNTAPVILAQPANRMVLEQEGVSFQVGAAGSAPLGYQWRRDGTNLVDGGRFTGVNAATLSITDVSTNDAGLYSVVVSNGFGTAISANAALTVFGFEGVPFRVVALQTNNSQVMDHNAFTGDDRGGIAVSSSRVFYNGDNSAAGFALNDLSGGTALGRVFDAWVSDLRERKIYSLANGTTPLTSGGGIATALIEHDGVSGLLTSNVIPLSTSITLTGNYGNVGLFAGYGRILVHNGTRMYAILLPTGFVVDLGAMAVPAHTLSENWAYWGLAEYYAG